MKEMQASPQSPLREATNTIESPPAMEKPQAEAQNSTQEANNVGGSGFSRTFKVIVAATQNGGIGKDGSIPWRLPGDMKYFKEVTSACSEGHQNAVIMGRKTWESIPAKFRPLPGRLNIVLTRAEGSVFEGATTMGSLQGALSFLADEEQGASVENVFVIGGGQIYAEALRSPMCDEVLVTRVYGEHECDVFFTGMEGFECARMSNMQEQKENQYRFEVHRKRALPVSMPGVQWRDVPRHEEHQYLDLIREIMENGVLRGDRTGTGTLSLFGRSMRFSLRDDVMPLLTTKRTFWRGIAEELVWFVAGCTDARVLQEKNVRIWDGNCSREFLDGRGLTENEEGDLGPVYGFQWRHFGAQYKTMHDDYSGEGIDQLKQIIETLKTNPTDRRMILSAWNPSDLAKMALPPCHLLCQFYVADGELSCQMYQRSADMGLGVPFNIASYALLTRLVARATGLKCGDLVHVIGDAHVYCNHVEPLKTQLLNEPRPFPTLRINPDKVDIDSFVYEDFEILDYKPHKSIKMDMAV